MASGSISAARGRKKVGESWLMLFTEGDEEGEGEKEGKRWDVRARRREVGGDIFLLLRLG